MARKRDKCIVCRRPLEPLKAGSASGPVCYPCFWGAKLLYEQGIETVDQIPPQLAPLIADMFRKCGYLWPDDLIKALEDKPFTKKDTEMERWWSPRGEA